MKPFNGVITATGTGGAFLLQPDTDLPENQLTVGFGTAWTANYFQAAGSTLPITTMGAAGTGSMASVAVEVDGQPLGSTNWYPLALIAKSNGQTYSGSLTAGAATLSAAASFTCDIWGFQYVRIWAVSGTITTGMAVDGASDKVDRGPILNNQINNSGNQTFGAGFTLSGATGTNTITLQPSLASAMNITDGTNTYLTVNSSTPGLNFGQNVTLTKLLYESTTTGITAHASGGQGSAVGLTTEVNAVTTVATSGDSVKLPASALGATVIVINLGANPTQVYGSGTDTINGVATATGVSQMPNSICLYVCYATGLWVAEGIGTGFSGSLPTNSYAAGLTAHSGGGQGSALALTATVNEVTTVAAQGDSVKLPASAGGLGITVINHGVNALQIFGSGTDTINGVATATGISVPVNCVATFFCVAAGNWDAQISQSTQPGIVSLTGTADAIPPHVAHTYVVNKSGVDSMTLAAPTATTDDGLIITVTSATANAHTITATGLLQTGTASVNVATFAAYKGASITLMAYQGKWNVISANGITFS